MIYIQTGTNNNVLTLAPHSESAFEWLLAYHPAVYTKMEDINQVKQRDAEFFIAGTLEGTKRNDEALKSRSLLVLDYDTAPDDFIRLIETKLPNSEWLAYPSISNGVKGTAPRWRLVINLDRDYIKDEHTALIEAVNGRLGIVTDASAEQWSQVMGLPTITAHNKLTDIIHHTGMPMKVDALLAYADQLTKEHPAPTKKPPSGYTLNFSKRRKKWMGKLLDSIVEGTSEGSRNVHLTKIAGSLFFSDAEPETVYNVLLFANDMLSEPLESDEVNKIFQSVLKREVAKY
ncbi:primase alpha helix C-terminal domain-containing protein [Lacticaseibacillus saniviri]